MMTELFRVLLIVGVLVFILIIMMLMKRGHLGLKYSLIWFITGIILLLCSLFPNILISLTHLIGIKSEVNAVFFIGVCFLLLIILFLTTVVSGLNDSIRGMAQNMGMLEKRIRELEEKNDEQ